MAGQRAEIRWVAERDPYYSGKQFRYPSVKHYPEHKRQYFTRRYNTHEEAALELINLSLRITEHKERVPSRPWRYTDWKLHELRLISWDDAGNTTVEVRSLA